MNTTFKLFVPFLIFLCHKTKHLTNDKTEVLSHVLLFCSSMPPVLGFQKRRKLCNAVQGECQQMEEERVCNTQPCPSEDCPDQNMYRCVCVCAITPYLLYMLMCVVMCVVIACHFTSSLPSFCLVYVLKYLDNVMCECNIDY